MTFQQIQEIWLSKKSLNMHGGWNHPASGWSTVDSNIFIMHETETLSLHCLPPSTPTPHISFFDPYYINDSFLKISEDRNCWWKHTVRRHNNTSSVTNRRQTVSEHIYHSGQVVVWFWLVDRGVAGSIPESTNFLTNSSGQATNALVSLFTKQ